MTAAMESPPPFRAKLLLENVEAAGRNLHLILVS